MFIHYCHSRIVVCTYLLQNSHVIQQTKPSANAPKMENMPIKTIRTTCSFMDKQCSFRKIIYLPFIRVYYFCSQENIGIHLNEFVVVPTNTKSYHLRSKISYEFKLIRLC